MDEISAGAGVGYFSLVWNIGGGLSESIVGGPSTLTGSLAAAQRVELGALVHEVVHKDDSVLVRYRQGGIDHQVEARCAVLATPAHISERIGVDLDRDVRTALSHIKYGPFVVTAFLTDETERQVWDDAYAIATPNRSFGIVLNPSNVARGSEARRRPGSSLMTFSTAGQAARLLDRDDAEIQRVHLDDLDRVLPGVASTVVEAHVQRWPLASPYCFPGRARLQPVLTRRAGRVFLAGDYLGSLYTETAIGTGLAAAQEVQSLLAGDRQTSALPFSL
jgi:oxygen-dependent protoporphyrinogen oxidase